MCNAKYDCNRCQACKDARYKETLKRFGQDVCSAYYGRYRVPKPLTIAELTKPLTHRVGWLEAYGQECDLSKLYAHTALPYKETFSMSFPDSHINCPPPDSKDQLQRDKVALHNETQRLRTQLETTQRELSNCRIARDLAQAEAASHSAYADGLTRQNKNLEDLLRKSKEEPLAYGRVVEVETIPGDRTPYGFRYEPSSYRITLDVPALRGNLSIRDTLTLRKA